MRTNEKLVKAVKRHMAYPVLSIRELGGWWLEQLSTLRIDHFYATRKLGEHSNELDC